MTSRLSPTLAWIGLAALVLGSCGGSSGGGAGGSAGSGATAGSAGTGGSVGNGGAGGTPAGGGGTGGLGGSSGGSSAGGVAGGVAGSSGGSSTGGTVGATGGRGGQTGQAGQTGIGGQSGAGGGAAGAAGGSRGGGGQAGATSFALTSTTLANGGAFPTDATCDTTMAMSQLPDLSWSGAPAARMSFALALVDTSLIDLTPPNANGFHWVMWDIPPDVSMLPQGLAAGSPPANVAGLAGSMQKRAPSGNAYLGPCPNFPSATHTKTDNYELRLYALSQASLPSNLGSMTVQQIVNAIEALPPIATAVLHGTSNAANTSLK